MIYICIVRCNASLLSWQIQIHNWDKIPHLMVVIVRSCKIKPSIMGRNTLSYERMWKLLVSVCVSVLREWYTNLHYTVESIWEHVTLKCFMTAIKQTVVHNFFRKLCSWSHKCHAYKISDCQLSSCHVWIMQ